MYGEYALLVEGLKRGLDISVIGRCIEMCSEYINFKKLAFDFLVYDVKCCPMIYGEHFVDGDREETVISDKNGLRLEVYVFVDLQELRLENSIFDTAYCILALYKHRDINWVKTMLMRLIEYLVKSCQVRLEISDSEEFLYNFITRDLVLSLQHRILNRISSNIFVGTLFGQKAGCRNFGCNYLCINNLLMRFNILYETGSHSRSIDWYCTSYIQITDELFAIYSSSLKYINTMGVYKITNKSIVALSKASFDSDIKFCIDIIKDLDIQ